MRIGVVGGDNALVARADRREALSSRRGIEAMVRGVQEAADQGLDHYWVTQVHGADALVSLAVAGSRVPGIELGVSVVPIFPVHPYVLAQQALSTQSAIGNRLLLGIGPSHKLKIEGSFGLSYERPLRHVREYLSILSPLVHQRSVSFEGEVLTARGLISIDDAEPFPILVAALGPKMLGLAGHMADGTITWMVGPRTLETHTVPTITAAAAEAGRREPRVVVGLPVCVTDDAAAAHEHAAALFEVYGTLPVYRAMLDREGAAGPADVAIVGNETTVRQALEQLASAGATDFIAIEFGATADERAATRALLASVATST